MKTFVLVGFLAIGASANATQVFTCKDTDRKKVELILTLENENGPLKGIKASSALTGFYKKSSGLGLGAPSELETDTLTPIFEDQIEGKPAITVWTEEMNFGGVLYYFTFSRELLGQAFEGRKVQGTIDPDSPEGGGYQLSLVCSSSGSL